MFMSYMMGLSWVLGTGGWGFIGSFYVTDFSSVSSSYLASIFGVPED